MRTNTLLYFQVSDPEHPSTFHIEGLSSPLSGFKLNGIQSHVGDKPRSPLQSAENRGSGPPT